MRQSRTNRLPVTLEEGRLVPLPGAPLAYAETDEDFADAVETLRARAVAGEPLDYDGLTNTIVTGLSGLAKSNDSLIRAWALHELMSLHSRQTKQRNILLRANEHRAKRMADVEYERKKLQVGRKSRAGKKGVETAKVRALTDQIQTPK